MVPTSIDWPERVEDGCGTANPMNKLESSVYGIFSIVYGRCAFGSRKQIESHRLIGYCIVDANTIR